MDYEIRAATADDEAAIVALLPLLADFDVPNERTAEELWRGDSELVRAWTAGRRPDVGMVVATDVSGLIGVAGISERAELLDGGPSAHLELLAVSESARGRGVGSALVREAERMAARRGLRSMSLHVFAANTRARTLYERHGFDGELVRYFKRLS